MTRRDTIFALSTARGRAGIAIVRVSGPGASDAIKYLTNLENLEERRAKKAAFVDPRTGEIIDAGLLIWFPSPASFTGEDVLELHIHGGLAVISGILDALGSIRGFRLAEPGEFTKRAFFNSKMDLTAVEGLADLIEAETAAQRRQALQQLSGVTGILYDKWREEIIGALARLEAYIDFPDEDLPPDLEKAIRASVGTVLQDISKHLDDDRRGERLREGIQVVILGPPNAGKSSLINALSKKNAAIVAEEAGTTRDVIEVHMDFGGYPIILSDTAGIRDARSPIEREGIERALARERQADLKLVVLDVSQDRRMQHEVDAFIDEKTIVVLNKADLVASKNIHEAGWRSGVEKSVLVSALKGTGIEELSAKIGAAVVEKLAVGEAPAITRTRHRMALEECKLCLERFERATLPELAAEDLRNAANALGTITGRVSIEELLDRIFGEFCIGK